MLKYQKNIAPFGSLLFVILSGILLLSCEELPCPGGNGVNVQMGFYKIEGNIISDLPIDSITIEYLNFDGENFSEFYQSPRTFLEIPLNISSDTSAIVIKYKNLLNDTLIFINERTLRLVSHECGFDMFFKINEIENTQNNLDSIWVRREIVDYANVENIRLYF